MFAAEGSFDGGEWRQLTERLPSVLDMVGAHYLHKKFRRSANEDCRVAANLVLLQASEYPVATSALDTEVRHAAGVVHVANSLRLGSDLDVELLNQSGVDEAWVLHAVVGGINRDLLASNKNAALASERETLEDIREFVRSTTRSTSRQRVMPSGRTIEVIFLEPYVVDPSVIASPVLSKLTAEAVGAGVNVALINQ